MIRTAKTRSTVALVLTLVLAVVGLAVGTGVASTAAAATLQDAPKPPPTMPTCTITGTDGPDVLVGTPEADVICGGHGADVIRGLGGNDVLRGGAGDDRLYGGAGHDIVLGERGDDVLRGGEGQDRLYGGGEDDLFIGGPDDDDIERRPSVGGQIFWQVNVTPIYNFPKGTTVHWSVDFGSANCSTDYGDWTDTVGNGQSTGHMVFFTSPAEPWDDCAYQPSYATFRVLATQPDGLKAERHIHVETGAANIFTREATTECRGYNDIACAGGHDSVINLAGHAPSPNIWLGPMQVPVDPKLECRGSEAVYKPGEKLDENNGHLCTATGFPLAAVTVTGLPPGITASRFPDVNGSWVILRGTLPTTPGEYPLVYTARLGTTYEQSQYLTLRVRN